MDETPENEVIDPNRDLESPKYWKRYVPARRELGAALQKDGKRLTRSTGFDRPIIILKSLPFDYRPDTLTNSY